MLSYSFYILLIQAWFGAVIITVNLPFVVYDPAVFNRVIGNRGTQIELWAWIMWMFLGLPLGAILVNVFRRTGPMVDVMARYRASPLQIGPNERPLFTACVIVGTIILGLTGYRLATMGDLPIMNALRTDDVNETLLLRRNFRMSTGFGTEILSSVFSFTVIVWMSYVAYAVMSVTKLSRWRVLFCVTFVASLVLHSANSTISPTFVYLLGFMIVRSMLGQPVIRTIEVIGGLALLVLMQIVLKGADRDVVLVLKESIVGRIMTGQLLGYYMTRNVFPDLENFIGFASTGTKIHELLGWPSSESYGILTMIRYNALGVESGTAGHMTTIFMGEAWANFGYVGLVIAPLWVGAVVQALNISFVTRPKTMVLVGLYAALATTLGYHTDIISFYYPLGTVLFVSGVGVIILVARFFGASSSDQARPGAPRPRRR